MLDFPSSPIVGEIYGSWVYDGYKWMATSTPPPSGGDITAVLAGAGLSGGGTSGDVTLQLAAPAFPAAGGTISGQTSIFFADASPYQLRVAGTTKGLRFRTASGLAAIEATDQTGSASFQPLVLGGSTISFQANGAARMSIDSSGSTINTYLRVEGPSNPLVVSSPGDARTMYEIQGVRLWSVGVLNSSGGVFHIADETGSAGRFIIDLAGATFNTTGSWSTISDASLKQSIQPYTRGLDALVALNPVTFQYVAGSPFAPAGAPSQPLTGLIAGDVEPYIPEIVGKTTIQIADGEKEVQVLAPGDLIYVLINALKELAARVEELEARPPHPPEAKPAQQ